MKRKLLAVFAFSLLIPHVVSADPGVGLDMWTNIMNKDNLFAPHHDFCDSGTETFISFAPDGRGYCIEKDERSAQIWTEARQICLSAGKRLPEPAEFQYACYHGSGLSNMTGNWEWTSNFAIVYNASSPTTVSLSVAVPVQGYTDCTSGNFHHVVNSFNTSSSHYFRCVR